MDDHMYYLAQEKARARESSLSKKLKYDEAKRNRDRRRQKTRINIGVAFTRWRSLMREKCFQSDAKVACFLLDSLDGCGTTTWKGEHWGQFKVDDDVGTDEVVVKVECLLQLFQKCFECCSKCSIATEHKGCFFYVTQKCQKCHYSREWTSHPPDQIHREPADKEVAEETVLLSFGESDTESEEDEEVKVDYPLSQSEEEEEEEEVKGHHVLREGFPADTSEDLSHTIAEKVNFPCKYFKQEEEEQEIKSLNPWSQLAEVKVSLSNTYMKGNDSGIHPSDASDNDCKKAFHSSLCGEEMMVEKMEEKFKCEVEVKIEPEDEEEAKQDVEMQDTGNEHLNEVEDGKVTEAPTNNQKKHISKETASSNNQDILNGGNQKPTRSSKQCIASDGNQECFRASSQGVATNRSNLEQAGASNRNVGDGIPGPIYIDIQGHSCTSHHVVSIQQASSKNTKQEEEDDDIDDYDDDDEDDDDDYDDDDDDDDDDWDPSCVDLEQPSASENEGSVNNSNPKSRRQSVPTSKPSPNGEEEVLVPLVWCSDCGSGFKRDCFRERHNRLYGCLKCGTNKCSEGDTNSGNTESEKTEQEKVKDGQEKEEKTEHVAEDAEATKATSNAQKKHISKETASCTNKDINSGRQDTACSSKQCIASDNNQESARASNQGAATTKSNQEASNSNGEGGDSLGTIYIDIQGHTSTSHHVATTQQVSSKNTEKAPGRAHSQSLHIQNQLLLFSSLNAFKSHAIECHGITRFRNLCTDCGKFITIVTTVDGRHLHTCEHKVKTVICPICGKRFASKGGLQLHITHIHNERKMLSCRYCLKAFKSHRAKEEHEVSHFEELLKYHCPHCSQRFPDRPSWCAHRKSHWPNGKNICEVCNKGFRHASQLIRHRVVHTGLKPYTCELCERSFNQPGHLKSHMRLHTGERPFKCQECEQCFNHNVSLKNHVQRYHGPGSEERKGKGRVKKKKTKKN